MDPADAPSFAVAGPDIPARPVVISVPHAGRDYPPALLAATRLPRERLELLEDRHTDRLARDCVEAGFTVIRATRARAWIDLNRDPREIDPDMIEPRPRRETLVRSARVTGGLGLLPRRLRGSGDIWGGRVALADLQRRLDRDYRPYHARLTELVAAARARHGVAVLLDLHSMPPIEPQDNASATIVIGDRFGQSAAARFAAALRAAFDGSGCAVAENIPYAGGHILATQADPRGGIHALQLEIDRSLYLDAALREPGPGFERMARLVRGCAEALECEALNGGLAIAAE